MKATDRLLQRWRIARALRWVPKGSRVLDVGCHDGALFRQGRGRIASGVGIDPLPGAGWPQGPFERRTGTFPAAAGGNESYDVIVMLAVVEHIDDGELHRWAEAAAALLTPGGRLVATVPSPAVDTILHVGQRLRLLDGMETHQHHGFDPARLPEIFTPAGFTVEHRGTFQLGLNNIFVLRR